MKLAVFDSHSYDRKAFEQSKQGGGHELSFFEPRLNRETARLATGFDAVCSFVNDQIDEDTLHILRELGVRLIALRCAGYNHVDLLKAQQLGIKLVRVPEYSPYAVAEHTVALILAMNRKVHRSFNRVRELNFSLEGLVGFDLYGKTVGVIGTGKIGAIFAGIMRGFGCRVFAFDAFPNPELPKRIGLEYGAFSQVLAESDILSLHVPLSKSTHHLLNREAFAQMKRGVMLVNTGRGALIETKALIAALKSGQIGYAGLDVYEEEEGVFFQDLSEHGLQDDALARLLTFPNVLITSHQAFLTREALTNIADTTLQSLSEFAEGRALSNEICWDAGR